MAAYPITKKPRRPEVRAVENDNQITVNSSPIIAAEGGKPFGK